MLGLLLWFPQTRPEPLLWNQLRRYCRFFQLNSHPWWSIPTMMMTTTEVWTIDELSQATALSGVLFYSHCCSINSFNLTSFALGLPWASGGHENTVKTHEFGGLYFHLKKCAQRAQQN